MIETRHTFAIRIRILSRGGGLVLWINASPKIGMVLSNLDVRLSKDD